MYRRILFPTDGSALSRKAARDAVALAARLEAELVVLNLVPRYPQAYFEGAISLSPAEIGRIEAQWTAQGQAIADAVRDAAEAAGVKVRTTIVRSDTVAEAILAAARKHRCDLIAMASHGRKGIRRLLLGSETQHVLTHGTIPVLVLR